MVKNVYEPPTSDITVPSDSDDRLIRARRLTVQAFLAAPVFSSSVLVGIALFVDGISGADFEFTGGVFFRYLMLTYALTFVLLLPIHWILGQFDKRKFYIYLGVGLVIPAPFVLISGKFESLVIWILAAGIGATWSVIFWFIAVFIYERKPSNKRMQSDPAKLGR